jgi:anti-sigma factor RsiW
MFSFHVSERTLDSLLRHRLSAAQLNRLKQHIYSCHACWRRVEEWRDNYHEVEAAIPPLEHTSVRVPSLPGSPVVLVPSNPGEFRASFDMSRLLWPAAVVLALAVGFGASRLSTSRSSEGMMPPPSETRLPPSAAPAPVSTPSAPVATPVATPRATPVVPAHDSSVTAKPNDAQSQIAAARQPTTHPAPRAPVTAQRAPAPSPHAVAPTVRDTVSKRTPQRTPAIQPSAPPARQPTPASSRPFTESTDSDAGSAARVTTFSRIGFDAAVRRLGGSIRLLEGLDVDHIEVGPGDSVPGAQRGADIVRVIYRARNGNRILLDQQRIPADASGWRHVNDPYLENGDTLVGTSPNGVSVATWVDPKAYWISLVGQMSQDSLKRMLRRVR